MSKKIIIIASLIILIFFIPIYIYSSSENNIEKYDQETLDNLAQCLTEKETTMYGAFWCPHCTNTKKKFGDSFIYVNYVECDAKCKPDENGKILAACKGYGGQPELCAEKEIKGYDTWIFADGTTAIGEPPLEVLDKRSGCNILPQ